MKTSSRSRLWEKKRVDAVLMLFAVAIASRAQTLTTLANFGGTDFSPPASFVKGVDGNFYGTTCGNLCQYPELVGNFGSIFKLTPGGVLTRLYTFCAQVSCTDGAEPGALIQAADGNFYSTTYYTGADYSSGDQEGYGTIFRITPSGTLTTLHTFNGNDGANPDNMILAVDGNFYGTTWVGGANNSGTVFKITPSGQLTTLYSFGSTSTDGNSPLVLFQGADRNLYGATFGNAFYPGTVFKITTSGTLTTLYTLTHADGNGVSDLIQATDGNFYGTTLYGGVFQQGSAFKLAPTGTFTTLYSFGGTSGSSDAGTLIQAADGNFYGVTGDDGNYNQGTIFELTPSGTFTRLYSFDITDGSFPGTLMQGSDGNLYGTTLSGGTNGGGTIFRYQLVTTPPPYSCSTKPTITFIDSASGYGGYSYFTSGSWLEIKGTNLVNPADPRLTAASNPGQWTGADFNGLNAPTVLDNISVTINGKPAFVWYLSPTQLNVQAPDDTATGNVAITVNNCTTASAPFMFKRQALAPGFLAPSNYSANGTQYLVATFASDGAYVLNTSLGASFGINSRPAKPGDLIIAYGIGFGDVTPTIAPGVIVEQSNTLVNPVTISFGSTSATIAYQGLAGNFVGLYEFYITVPQGLANGDYQINVQQNGVAVPQTAYLTVHS
jgi:uncharacterized protein (TIGR03437 family)